MTTPIQEVEFRLARHLRKTLNLNQDNKMSDNKYGSAPLIFFNDLDKEKADLAVRMIGHGLQLFYQLGYELKEEINLTYNPEISTGDQKNER